MSHRIPVISVVAYSGTGKTTLLEKLIPALRRRSVRVAIIKHDAHDFEVDKEGKDSWRLSRAGAEVTIIASATKAAIMENRHIPIHALIARIQDVDLIITEGYKRSEWPKIALLRAETGKPFPVSPDTCLAVMADVPVETDTPCFHLDDIEGLADLIVRRMDTL